MKQLLLAILLFAVVGCSPPKATAKLHTHGMYFLITEEGNFVRTTQPVYDRVDCVEIITR